MPDSDPADFYTGLVAEAYEALKSHTFEPARYAAFVRTHGEPGLEVGCGEGHPLLELAAEGLDVDGVDSSADMIDRARSTARAQGLDVGLHVARMQDMDLGRRYGSIYLAGPTFELLPDDQAALETLRTFARHLNPDGVVMIPLWIPEPTPDNQLTVAREAVDDTGTRLRYTPLSEHHDSVSRTRRTTVRYERIRVDGPSELVEKDWIIHWQTLESITELARQAGLSVRVVDPPSDQLSGAPGEEFTVQLVPVS